MGRRVACICRAVRQGEVKNPSCAWVQQLPWRGSAATGARAKPAKPAPSRARPPASEKSQKYVYGFDARLQLAW
eukprot:7090437-Alexandrium_andersonii.AAC.1